ncbi:MAG: hypothetical protein ACYC26_12285 [Phycisphaerales bacterium]
MPYEWSSVGFPYPFVRYVANQWDMLQIKLASVEALILQGTVRHYYEGFAVEDGRTRHEFLDYEEQDVDKPPLRDLDRTPSQSEVARYHVPEIWLHRYVQARAARFHLTRLSKPQAPGPDFKAKYRGQWVEIEVEVSWQCWFAHKHDNNSDFEDVDFLILLKPDKPPATKQAKFPKGIKIRVIDHDDFVQWIESYPRCNQEDERRNQARRRYLANMLHELWDEFCKAKEQCFQIPDSLVGASPKSRIFFQVAVRLLPRDGGTNHVKRLDDWELAMLPAAIDPACRRRDAKDRVVIWC